MVKKRMQKVKKRRSVAAAQALRSAGSDQHGGGSDKGPSPPEHIRRKVARQSQFMQKIVDNQKAILSAKKTSLKKNKRRKPVSGALVDLSSLSSALKEAASSDAAKAEEKAKPKGLGVGGARHRMRIKCPTLTGRPTCWVQPYIKPLEPLQMHTADSMPSHDREAARLEQVLAHPQFIADPVSAITAHLAATLPPKPPPRQSPTNKGGAGSKKHRRREAERQRQMQTD